MTRPDVTIAPFSVLLILNTLLLPFLLSADGPGVIVSRHAAADFPLTADPTAAQWKDIPGVFAENGPRGEPAPGLRTEIRSRWTASNLYFLFVCPYRSLNLKPDPTTGRETNQLWNWDVAEAFIGTDLQHIRRYKEFEVSPQGEWVDLDIDRDHPQPDGGWHWDSGFRVKARIDPERKIWYAEMQIPLEALGIPKPADGDEIRANLYRIEGAAPNRTLIAWQPTHAGGFHVPEAFGRLRFAR